MVRDGFVHGAGIQVVDRRLAYEAFQDCERRAPTAFRCRFRRAVVNENSWCEQIRGWLLVLPSVTVIKVLIFWI